MTQSTDNQAPSRPQRQVPRTKVRGVQTPNPQFGQQLQQGEQIELPDLSSDAFAEVRNAQQTTFEAIAKANQAQAEATIADLKAEGFSPEGQKLAAVGSEILNTVNTIQKRKAEVQARKEEARKAKLEQIRKEKANTAKQVLNDKVVEFQQTVRESGLKKGVQAFRKEGQRVLDKFRDQLSPEQFEELQETFNNTLNEAQQDLTKREQENARQVKENKEKIAASKAKLQVTSALAGLEQTDDPDVAEQKLSTALQTAEEVARSRSDEISTYQNILLPVLEEINQSAEAGAEARSKARQKATQVQDYISAVKPAYQQYNNGNISSEQLKAKIETEARVHGVPELAGEVLQTREEKRKEVNDRLRTEQKTRELARSKNSAIDPVTAKDFSNVQIGRIVRDYTLDKANARFQIQQSLNTEGKEAVAKTIQGIAKNFKKDVQNYRELELEVLQATQEIADLKVNNREVLFDEFIPDVQYDKSANRLRIPKQSEAVQKLAEQNGVQTQVMRRKLETLVNEKDSALRRLNQIKSKWEQYRLNVKNPEDDEDLVEAEKAFEPLQQEVKRQPRPQSGELEMRGNNLPNPRSGDANTPMTPAVSSLAKSDDGVFVRPFRSEDSNKVQVTSGYGHRQDPNGSGTEIHNGVDYAVPVGTPVKTVQGGKVLWNKRLSGFGKTVAIQTPDGHTEMYAHLSEFEAQAGQEVPPGTTVAKSGSTGAGSGPHLHMQVYKGKPSFGNRSEQFASTVNPADYLRLSRQNTAEPRGQGTPPNQKLPGGDGQVGNREDSTRAVRDQHNSSNPARVNTKASPHKRDYPDNNDLTANYGYEALKNDPEFANKVNSVANSLGIPGQWLADIMAHETDGTFSTEIQSYDPSVNSQGLIQFTQSTARRMGTTLKHLSSLSRTEQMDWVRKFLEENQGNYDSIYDVVAQIYGGDPAFRKFNRTDNPAKEMMRKPKWRRYLKGLGEQTGRKYRFPTDRRKMSSQRVHDRQTDGCPECNKMMEENGFVTPHMIG